MSTSIIACLEALYEDGTMKHVIDVDFPQDYRLFGLMGSSRRNGYTVDGPVLPPRGFPAERSVRLQRPEDTGEEECALSVGEDFDPASDDPSWLTLEEVEEVQCTELYLSEGRVPLFRSTGELNRLKELIEAMRLLKQAGVTPRLVFYFS